MRSFLFLLLAVLLVLPEVDARRRRRRRRRGRGRVSVWGKPVHVACRRYSCPKVTRCYGGQMVTPRDKMGCRMCPQCVKTITTVTHHVLGCSPAACRRRSYAACGFGTWLAHCRQRYIKSCLSVCGKKKPHKPKPKCPVYRCAAVTKCHNGRIIRPRDNHGCLTCPQCVRKTTVKTTVPPTTTTRKPCSSAECRVRSYSLCGVGMRFQGCRRRVKAQCLKECYASVGAKPAFTTRPRTCKTESSCRTESYKMCGVTSTFAACRRRVFHYCRRPCANTKAPCGRKKCWARAVRRCGSGPGRAHKCRVRLLESCLVKCGITKPKVTTSIVTSSIHRRRNHRRIRRHVSRRRSRRRRRRRRRRSRRRRRRNRSTRRRRSSGRRRRRRRCRFFCKVGRVFKKVARVVTAPHRLAVKVIKGKIRLGSRLVKSVVSTKKSVVKRIVAHGSRIWRDKRKIIGSLVSKVLHQKKTHKHNKKDWKKLNRLSRTKLAKVWRKVEKRVVQKKESTRTAVKKVLSHLKISKKEIEREKKEHKQHDKKDEGDRPACDIVGLATRCGRACKLDRNKVCLDSCRLSRTLNPHLGSKHYCKHECGESTSQDTCMSFCVTHRRITNGCVTFVPTTTTEKPTSPPRTEQHPCLKKGDTRHCVLHCRGSEKWKNHTERCVRACLKKRFRNRGCRKTRSTRAVTTTRRPEVCSAEYEARDRRRCRKQCRFDTHREGKPPADHVTRRRRRRCERQCLRRRKRERGCETKRPTTTEKPFHTSESITKSVMDKSLLTTDKPEVTKAECHRGVIASECVEKCSSINRGKVSLDDCTDSCIRRKLIANDCVASTAAPTDKPDPIETCYTKEDAKRCGHKCRRKSGQALKKCVKRCAHKVMKQRGCKDLSKKASEKKKTNGKAKDSNKDKKKQDKRRYGCEKPEDEPTCHKGCAEHAVEHRKYRCIRHCLKRLAVSRGCKPKRCKHPRCHRPTCREGEKLVPTFARNGCAMCQRCQRKPAELTAKDCDPVKYKAHCGSTCFGSDSCEKLCVRKQAERCKHVPTTAKPTPVPVAHPTKSANEIRRQALEVSKRALKGCTEEKCDTEHVERCYAALKCLKKLVLATKQGIEKAKGRKEDLHLLEPDLRKSRHALNTVYKRLRKVAKRKGKTAKAEALKLDAQLKKCMSRHCRANIVRSAHAVKKVAATLSHIAKHAGLEEQYARDKTIFAAVSIIGKDVQKTEVKMMRRGKAKAKECKNVRCRKEAAELMSKERTLLRASIRVVHVRLSAELSKAATCSFNGLLVEKQEEKTTESSNEGEKEKREAGGEKKEETRESQKLSFCKSKLSVLKARLQVVRVELSLCDAKKCHADLMERGRKLTKKIRELNSCKADKEEAEKKDDDKAAQSKESSGEKRKHGSDAGLYDEQLESDCPTRRKTLQAEAKEAEVEIELCDSLKCRLSKRAKLHHAKAAEAALKECAVEKKAGEKQKTAEDKKAEGRGAVAQDACDDEIASWHTKRERANTRLAELYKKASKCETRQCTKAALKNLATEHKVLENLVRPVCAKRFVDKKDNKKAKKEKEVKTEEKKKSTGKKEDKKEKDKKETAEKKEMNKEERDEKEDMKKKEEEKKKKEEEEDEKPTQKEEKEEEKEDKEEEKDDKEEEKEDKKKKEKEEGEEKKEGKEDEKKQEEKSSEYDVVPKIVYVDAHTLKHKKPPAGEVYMLKKEKQE